MKIQSLFKDDIHRQIDGVIKADDDSNLIQEVSEYVITNEIGSKLDRFLEAYNDTRHNNTGVWISGFFGCGKSHLLKMLSLLLEDRQVKDTKLVDLFIPKIEDEMLKAQFKKAITIPSKSILFNIDQNANQIGNGEDDILSVFLKVFNGMQGYYENSPYIAEFESHLDDDGLLEEFKSSYEDETGEPWETGRETAHLLDNEEFAKVLAKVKSMSEEEALKTLDRYENSFNLSIKSFAEKVKKYLSKQAPGSRINFFVDEVGQYIAGKGNLMLNLQTLAETLTTVCEGRAWVIVTSQEDMEAIIGDMDSTQNNDFSKIQGRFPTRVSLTSSDVAEVIQRRLLTKTESSASDVHSVYEKESNNIRTIFKFGDNSKTYQSYRDGEHFSFCYPFLPYQFDLFQESIYQLSRHNAFEGKHRSVGERSMLSVFQEVVKNLSDLNVGQVATFDMMFEGLRQALKSESLKSVHQAEKQLTHEPFCIKVLKALFLVKFDNTFKATLRNIAILLIDSFDADLTDHEKNVKEALNKLELESYIQRVGETYEFLTDTEKDIENEIKDTDIEITAVGDLLKEIIYGEILRDSKIRFEDNGYDYPFTRKIDDNNFGKEQELGINILTQLNDRHGDEGSLTSMFRNADEMLIVLPADSTLVDDLRIYKKTEKYVMINNSQQMRDEKKNIIQSKASANRNRHAGLLDKLTDLLAQSRFYVNGNLVEVKGTEPKVKVQKAFQELIRQSYPHLKMLKKQYEETFLKDILLNPNQGSFKPENNGLNEAQKELLNTINREKNKGSRSTVKSLLEVFERKPYGWYQNAVLCLTAELFELNQIEIRQDSTPLNSRELYNNLTNNRALSNTIIEPQQQFTEKQISDLKNYHRELFDTTNTGTDAKTVAEFFRDALDEERQDLEKLLEHKGRYAFLDKIQSGVDLMKGLISRDYGHYLTSLRSFEDDLLDEKENHIDKIKKFMNGDMKKIYDEAIAFLEKSNANMHYLTSDEVGTLKSLEGFKEPYKGNAMQNIKSALDKVREEEQQRLEEYRDSTRAMVVEEIETLKGSSEFTALEFEEQQVLIRPVETLLSRIDEEKLIPVIENFVQLAKRETNAALTQAVNLLNSRQPVNVGVGEKDRPAYEPEVKVEIVRHDEVKLKFTKSILKTEDDVNEYVVKMKDEYLKMIRNNKQIRI
jgi:hypothetical protein